MRLPWGVNVRFWVWFAFSLGLALVLSDQLAQARPASGPVTGALTLQGRTLHNGALVYVDNAPNPVATTSVDGVISFNVAPGSRLITVRRPGFLSSQITVNVPAGSLQLPDLQLRAGDADGNDRVGLTDLLAVGIGYGSEPPVPISGDINADGRISLLDLLLVSTNYGLEGPQPWNAQIGPTVTATPSPTATEAGAGTPTPTSTIIPTRTATPYVPTDLCVFIFRDADSDGRWDPGETALPGRRFWIYSATSQIIPENALATYQFNGTELLPRCFPNQGLENGTFRIQLETPPLPNWGRIFSDPLGPVQVVPNVQNVWEVDVEDGKAVFFSFTAGTPQPTPTITTLTLCGIVTTYVAPQGTTEGVISIQGQLTHYIAPGATITNVGGLQPGANGCLTANFAGSGFIISGAWAAATPTSAPTATPNP